MRSRRDRHDNGLSGFDGVPTTPPTPYGPDSDAGSFLRSDTGDSIRKKSISKSATGESQRELLRIGSGLSTPRRAGSITPSATGVGYHGGDADDHPRLPLPFLVVAREWFMELAGWTVATASLVVIVGLLGHFHNRNMRDWTSWISINAMVSVLSQAAMSALLVPVSSCISQNAWLWFKEEHRLSDLDFFDLASRGPQGSARFLYDRKRVLQLGAVGAFLTIFMLAFQPFAQQAVSTNGRRWENSTITGASVNRATMLQYYQPAWDQETRTKAMLIAPPMIVLYGVLSGLTDYQDYSSIKAVCYSSNCTWDPFTTLAYCYTVENITDSVTQKCHTDANGTYTCDFGSSRMLADQVLTVPDANIGVFTSSELEIGKPFKLQDSMQHFPLFNMTILYRDAGQDANSTQPFQALTARLGLCVKTLVTNALNGTTNTTDLGTRDDVKWSGESADGYSGTFTGRLRDASDGLPDDDYIIDFESAITLTRSFSRGLTMTGKTTPVLNISGNPFIENPPFAVTEGGSFGDSILMTAFAETVFGLNLNAKAFYPSALELWDARMSVFSMRLTNTYVFPSANPSNTD